MRLPNIDGGSWVDIFGVVILVRLAAPLFHLPPMNVAEAGVWGTTIAAFAASNIGRPKV
jgi:hypothetical protein